MQRRIISLFFILLLLFSLAACGSKETPADEPIQQGPAMQQGADPTPEQNETVPPVTDEPPADPISVVPDTAGRTLRLKRVAKNQTLLDGKYYAFTAPEPVELAVYLDDERLTEGFTITSSDPETVELTVQEDGVIWLNAYRRGLVTIILTCGDLQVTVEYSPGLVIDSSPESPTVNWQKQTGCDPFLDMIHYPAELGAPQYTLQEIQAFVSQGITLQEAAEKITTLADALQLLHQKGYSSTNGDLDVYWNGTEWSVNRSAEQVYAANQGNCGGGSNLLNCLLAGDYDSQGYVGYSAISGGHIFNYFEADGVYYYFDLTRFVRDNWTRPDRDFFAGTPQNFAKHYVDSVNRKLSETDDHRLLLLFQYEYEGNHLPKGNSGYITPSGKYYYNVLPAEYKDVTTVLYSDAAYPAAEYWESPPVGTWPPEAQ